MKNLREHVAVTPSTINLTQREIIGAVPEITPIVGALYGWYEETKKFIDRGGKVRIISVLSHPTIELGQQAMDIGGHRCRWTRLRWVHGGDVYV